MKKLLFLVTVAMLVFGCAQQQNTESDGHELRFRDGKLRILQFSDVHWCSGQKSDKFIPELIKASVESERPDVLVFTGDVVKAPVKQGWTQFVDLMHEIGLPYAVMMGNHDPESPFSTEEWSRQTTRDSIFTFLEKSPLFLGEKGPAELPGMGNYVVPVLASDGSDKVKGLLYCMDSNDYHNDPRIEPGPNTNIWLSSSQIDWYRQQSRSYTEANGGRPLPALAFFHIPLYEYNFVKDKPETIGERDEYVFCPAINSGMFHAMFEMGDVMGTFVGHDHNNDYIGQHCGIALAYCKAAGVDTYGDFAKGCRVIDMFEDGRYFDTWLYSPEKGRENLYHYPSALSEKDSEGLEMMPAQEAAPVERGVAYRYYEGEFQCVADIAGKGRLAGEGVMQSFDITGAKATDHFGYEFSAWLDIKETGVYKFRLNSDDGSVLCIDNQLVIDNDGSHSSREKFAKVLLEVGFHDIKVIYFDDTDGQTLQVGMSGKRASGFDDVLYVKD